MSAKQRAFTLVELVVAAFILAVAVTALIGALGGLERAERAVAQKELVERIAHEKLEELVATQAWQSESGGSFDRQELRDYTWSLDEVDVGIENVTGLRVTVTSLNKGRSVATTLVYVPPQTGGQGVGQGP